MNEYVFCIVFDKNFDYHQITEDHFIKMPIVIVLFMKKSVKLTRNKSKSFINLISKDGSSFYYF